ncbi:MAG: DUF1566 domain-containing protein [Bacteroidales bacterium]|nr:DUF1566 domain-containing protein [Bacteroidales bacterium]
MKKVNLVTTAILFTTVMFMPFNAHSQSPEKMSYQAVIRNNNNQLVINTQVGMKISILKGSASGTVVYAETQKPTTNADGLVSFQIGDGTVVSGSFSGINWADGTYFIKTETDPSGGTNYTISGANQLLSVPYALNAKTAENVPKHFIGENYGGGIVFYVYDNGQHGLIAATSDQSAAIRWYAGSHKTLKTNRDGVGTGYGNTSVIIAAQGNGDGNNYAALLCSQYSVEVNGVVYGDWYLPSKKELLLLFQHRIVVGGFADARYWTSTEQVTYTDSAWVTDMGDGGQVWYNKSQPYHVRAIRAF